MPISRLLKSCATPPASSPMLSSFCESRSCWSIRLRSVMSVTMATPPRSLPAASIMGSTVIRKLRSPRTRSVLVRRRLSSTFTSGGSPAAGGINSSRLRPAISCLARPSSAGSAAFERCIAPCASSRRHAVADGVEGGLPFQRRIAAAPVRPPGGAAANAPWPPGRPVRPATRCSRRRRLRAPPRANWHPPPRPTSAAPEWRMSPAPP